MRTKNICFFLIFFAPLISYADSYSHEGKYFEKCLSEAIRIKPGTIIKVEMKLEEDMHVYEFDLRDENNRDWDIECNAETATIVEIEEEVPSPQHIKFQSAVKIGLKRAKSIALEKYPGEIIEIEYELEEGGLAVYEFDISTEDGQEIKIEINATTGEVNEVTRELWQIGYE